MRMPAAARRGYAKRAIATLLALAVAMALTPGVASADAPSAPVASAYLARLTHVPAGVRAKVVDGYVRMWLSVPARDTLVVLDYRGVPYLRFARAGVAVNERSEMYFLNATPVAQAPPPGLQRSPRWVQVSGRHSYEWHDARLSALTTVALSPGQSYVGRWRTRRSSGSGRSSPCVRARSPAGGCAQVGSTSGSRAFSRCPRSAVSPSPRFRSSSTAVRTCRSRNTSSSP